MASANNDPNASHYKDNEGKDIVVGSTDAANPNSARTDPNASHYKDNSGKDITVGTTEATTAGRSSSRLPSDNPQLAKEVQAAKDAGFNNADIANAAASGKALLPSQSSQTQAFVKQAQNAGFNNADIANAAISGKALLPSQSSQTQEYVSQAKAQGKSNADIANAATGNQPAQRVDSNINPATGQEYGTYLKDTRGAAQKFLDSLGATQTELPPPNETYLAGLKRVGVATTVGAAEGAFGFGKAVVEPVFNLVFHPIQTAKGIYKLATDSNTREQAKAEIQKEFAERPARAIGELFGTIEQPELIEKGITKQPFKVRDITIPTETGEVVGKSITAEFGTTAIPIASKIGIKKPQFFKIDISEEVAKFKEGSDFKPGNPTETKAYIEALKKIEDNAAPEQIARRQEAITVGQDILKQTRGVKSKFISEVPLQTERLSPEAVQGLLNEAKKEGASGKVVLFGSGSRRAQIPSSISNFIPRDIDIRLPDASPEALNRVIPNAIRSLEERGYSARRGTGKDGLPDETIEVKFAYEKSIPVEIELQSSKYQSRFKPVKANERGEYVKVVEFKGKGLQTEDLEQNTVPDFVLGIPKESEPILINEQYTTPLEEELRGVMQGTIRVTKRPPTTKAIITTYTLAEDEFLHATPTTNAQSILQKGIKPNEGVIYLAKDEEMANTGILLRGEKTKGTIFKVKLTPKQFAEISKNKEIFDNRFIEGTITSKILPKQITIVKQEPEGVIDVFPPPKRHKDIKSVVISAETLLQSKSGSTTALRTNLERFKELYNYKEGEIQLPTEVTFDFSKPKEVPSPNSPRIFTTRSPSPKVLVEATPKKFVSPRTQSPNQRSPQTRSPNQRFESPSTNTRSPNNVQSEVSSHPSSPTKSSISKSPNKSLIVSPSPASPNISPPISPPNLPSNPPSTSPSPSPKSPNPPPLQIISQIGTPKKRKLYVIDTQTKKRKATGYDVFVRTKGKFKQINTRSLSEDEAINYGAIRVENTAAATFRLSPSNQPAEEGVFNIRARLQDFVRKEGKTFVQKLGKRIQSSGEKREITFKGIATNQQRRRFQRRK